MCWKCGAVLTVPKPVNRTECCPSCDALVRCFKNCILYDPGAHYDCHESLDEAFNDKEGANFCDWFSLKGDAAPSAGAAPHSTKTTAAKAAFDQLFGA
jgi:hypothetical protein